MKNILKLFLGLILALPAVAQNLTQIQTSLFIPAGSSLQAVAGTATAVTCTVDAVDQLNSQQLPKHIRVQLPSSAAPIYTPGTGFTGLVSSINCNNPSGSQVTGVEFFEGGTANANAIYGPVSIDSHGLLSYLTGAGWSALDSNSAKKIVGSTSLTAGVGINISSGAINLTAPVTVPLGGSGQTTLTNHGLLLGQGTSPVISPSLGTSTTLLHGNASGDPAFSAVVNGDISGQVSAAHGGTGIDSSALSGIPHVASGVWTTSAVDLSTIDVTGILACARAPPFTGDVTSSSGTCALALANIPNDTPAVGSILHTAIAAPATPASGKGRVYVDSTSKNIAVKNDAGTVNHGIQTRTTTANNYLQSIADDGSTTIGQVAVSGLSGLGTGVGTALGTNVGTAGAFVVNGGALGTPSSGTLANATGLPIGTGVSGLGSGVGSLLGGTSSGTGGPVGTTGATLSAAFLNKRCMADQQAGATADVQINACNTTLIGLGGGIIDATGYGPTTQSINAVVSVGDASGHPVALVLDRSTQFTVTVTGGAGVDAIKHFIRSSIETVGMGNPLIANFVVAATTNVNAIFATYPRTSQWVGEVKGVVIQGNPSATVLSEYDYSGTTALADFQNVGAYNFNGNGLKLTANSGATLDSFVCYNCSMDGVGGTTGCPVLIDGTASSNVMRGITFIGGTIVHPGASCASHAMIDAEGGASDLIQGLHLYSTDFESANTSDIGALLNNVLSIDVIGVSCSSNVNQGSDCVKITQTANVTFNVVITNLSQLNAWTNTLNDVADGVVFTGAAYPRVSSYTVQEKEGAYRTNKAIVQPRPNSDNAITASSAGINSTETIVVKSKAAIPASRLTVGSHIHAVLDGSNTASAANVSTFAVRIGTLGTTGDGLMASCATTASATGTALFRAEIDLTIASSTTAIGRCIVYNQGAVGIITTAVNVILPTFTAFNTATASQFLDVTYKAAAATTTSTFSSAQLEVLYQ